MTIRMLTSQLELTITQRPGAPHVLRLNGARLVECDTLKEAEQAKRAFETVLAPRFTRDEAIAIVKAHTAGVKSDVSPSSPEWSAYLLGLRAALEALAAAGAFSDQPCAETCNPRTCRNSMTAKLDAAGIR